MKKNRVVRLVAVLVASSHARRFGWIIAAWPLIGLLLLGYTAQLARADPEALFVSTTGTGTACTQNQPCDLQTALNRAADGDVIYLASGIYRGTGDKVIHITKELTLYGGWDGAATGPLVRDPVVYPTILDGENTRRIVYVSGNISFKLDGLHLTNGSTNGDGGGLYVAQAHPTVSNCRIFSNTAGFSGGGVYLNNSTGATLLSNEIYSNTTSTFYGGGVYVRNSLDAALVNNTLYGNAAHGGGGGVYLDNGAQTTLLGNNIFSNIGDSYGGGVFVANSAGVRLENNYLLSNHASQGGGIYLNNSSNAALTGNTIEGNTSESSGAGVSIYTHSDGTTLTGNVIRGNIAGGEGAGVYIHDSANAVFINNMVVTNHLTSLGSSGAGLYGYSTDVHLWHTTIARNTGGSGQGIHLQNGATAWLTNTILVSHTVGIEAGVGTTATLAATLWGSGIWANGQDTLGSGTLVTGTVNVWGDPLFVDPGGGDHHIGPGSAAIDRGINVAVETDIDNQPRPYQEHDLGADEYWPPGLFTRVYLPLVLK